MSSSDSCSMPERFGAELASYTTMRVGGPIGRLLVAGSAEQLVDHVREADEAGQPVLVLGGGSNVLVGDAGFPGTVILVATRGTYAEQSDCGGALVTVAAGEPWDNFVAYALAHGWVGLEALSGIPGLVGASPIQNVGAYGAEVSSTIARVRTLDRQTGQLRTFAGSECEFGYRSSVFKAELGRYLILEVTFHFPLGDLSEPIRYAELARTLGVQQGERAPAAEVRAAVLGLRAGKGMVLDAADHDSWSAGSFFTNPILTAEAAAALPADAPRFPADGGRVKSSAAWLIEHAGFGKGYGSGAATLSTKHCLALTNRGRARAEDILALAREVRDGVADRFGVTLVPEPVLVGCSL